jgi:hypothetical protein
LLLCGAESEQRKVQFLRASKAELYKHDLKTASIPP